MLSIIEYGDNNASLEKSRILSLKFLYVSWKLKCRLDKLAPFVNFRPKWMFFTRVVFVLYLEKPDVTLVMQDGDLVDLMTGKLNSQKAFFQGKLKVSLWIIYFYLGRKVPRHVILEFTAFLHLWCVFVCMSWTDRKSWNVRTVLLVLNLALGLRFNKKGNSRKLLSHVFFILR